MNGSGNLFVPLRLTPGIGGVYLKGLSGADEMALENTDTKNLIRLLESLMHIEPNENKVNAAKIVTADRDRLLALLYISMYGTKIESTVSCRECNQKFDLDFSLDELLSHFKPTLVTNNGQYQLESSISFRLPNGEDELYIDGLNVAEAERKLLERCLIKGNADKDSEKVQSKMAELAPVLSMEMKAVCPECENEQQIQFDMQSFFLTKLIQEKPDLIREVHNIASHYHWSLQEILSLPRNIRKQYAALIQTGN